MSADDYHRQLGLVAATSTGTVYSMGGLGGRRLWPDLKVMSPTAAVFSLLSDHGGGEVAIHDRDGLIQELTTYPSRGVSAKAKRRQVTRNISLISLFTCRG